ncbi:hypothetical protein GQ457_06G022480 [Hibiscus cannabinus]
MAMRSNFGSSPTTSFTHVVSRDVLSGFTLMPVCAVCEKRQGGECRKKLGVCFQCGSMDHFMRDCPHSSSVAHTPAPTPAIKLLDLL